MKKREIEQMLTPRGDFRASDDLKKRIMEQAAREESPLAADAAVRRRSFPVWVRYAAPVAAAAAVVVAIVRIAAADELRFRGARTPDAVYSAYLDRVEELRLSLAKALDGDSEEIDSALAQITEEAVPLFDQLPDELDVKEKTRILKQYYGELLAGAGHMARELKKR